MIEEPAEPVDPHKQFKEEMKFYLKKTKLRKNKEKEFQERQDSCAPEAMFKSMLEHVEGNNSEKMPVRKFFNNTFGHLLNDAAFLLKKKQEKAKGKEAAQLYTTQGMVKFVANYLIDNNEEEDEAEDEHPDSEKEEVTGSQPDETAEK